jgi:hypothetical protein
VETFHQAVGLWLVLCSDGFLYVRELARGDLHSQRDGSDHRALRSSCDTTSKTVDRLRLSISGQSRCRGSTTVDAARGWTGSPDRAYQPIREREAKDDLEEEDAEGKNAGRPKASASTLSAQGGY